MNSSSSLLRSKMFWVGILYFAEGFPLGIFYDLLPVHFRQQGIQLSEIGFLSLLGLSWTLKFLWAPAVDHYRHHRRWMLAVDLGMGVVMLALAVYSGFGPWMWVAIGLFTLLSATNDIAIDGYTIEMLDKREMGLANGLRIGFYRVGMLAAGVLLILSHHIGWNATYLTAAALFIGVGFVCLMAPPERVVAPPSRNTTVWAELVTVARHPSAFAVVTLFLLGTLWLVNRTTKWSSDIDNFWWYAFGVAGMLVAATLVRRPSKREPEQVELAEGPMFGALMEMLKRPYILPGILFILTFKLGDSAMGFMVKPFWVDAGFTAEQIGFVSVNLGLALSIAGGVAGGWFTDRLGIYRALWILGLFQALSNLGYAWVASVLPLHPEGALLPMQEVLMYSASAAESFTGGLGTAAFLAFLMAIVDKRHSATEYALLSSVFALSRSLSGWAGGFGAESLGYADYFFLTFLLSFPAYLLLPWVSKMLGLAEGSKAEEAKVEA